MDGSSYMTLIPFKSSLNALHSDLFEVPYLTPVTVVTHGEPKMSKNRIFVYNIVNRTSYRTPMMNVLITGAK